MILELLSQHDGRFVLFFRLLVMLAESNEGLTGTPTKTGTIKISSPDFSSVKGAGLNITRIDANEIIGQLDLFFHPLVLLLDNLIHDHIT